MIQDRQECCQSRRKNEYLGGEGFKYGREQKDIETLEKNQTEILKMKQPFK